MKHKLLAYALLPALSVGFLGINIASAHGWFGGMGMLSAGEIAIRHQAMFQQQAEVLGISVDEVKAAWAEGKSLKELAREKGITEDQLHVRMKEAMTQQMKSQLQTLVDKGIITQAQADRRLQVMQERLQQTKGRMGRGFHGWFRF